MTARGRRMYPAVMAAWLVLCLATVALGLDRQPSVRNYDFKRCVLRGKDVLCPLSGSGGNSGLGELEFARGHGHGHNHFGAKPGHGPPPQAHPDIAGAADTGKPVHAGGGGFGLVPVRALIEPAEVPPPEVGAYGLVAFTSVPIKGDIERGKSVCEAFKATLIAQEDVGGTPLPQQMITYWPVRNRTTPAAVRFDCDYLLSNYDLKTGLDALADADRTHAGLTLRRGPFLIAWSPSTSRYEPDPVVLVADMSSLDDPQSFLDVFMTWREKITNNPELWSKGFDFHAILLTFRDLLDRYGDGLLKLIRS